MVVSTCFTQKIHWSVGIFVSELTFEKRHELTTFLASHQRCLLLFSPRFEQILVLSETTSAASRKSSWNPILGRPTHDFHFLGSWFIIPPKMIYWVNGLLMALVLHGFTTVWGTLAHKPQDSKHVIGPRIIYLANGFPLQRRISMTSPNILGIYPCRQFVGYKHWVCPNLGGRISKITPVQAGCFPILVASIPAWFAWFIIPRPPNILLHPPETMV